MSVYIRERFLLPCFCPAKAFIRYVFALVNASEREYVLREIVYR